MRYIYLLLFLSPLPFASNPAVWKYFWVVYIGVLGFVFVLRQDSLKFSSVPRALHLLIGALVLLVFWGMLQVLFGWSATPQHTITTALFLVSHIVWFLLVFNSFKQKACVPKFVLTAGLIVTVYCIYGLAEYFSGNNFVLWYKKWASHGALTSTFVNRNSFAAYAGMGFQCILSYTLWSYLQRPSRDISRRHLLLHFFTPNYYLVTMLISSLFLIFTSLLLTGSKGGISTSLFASFLMLLTLFSNKKKASKEASNEPRKNIAFIVSIVLFFAVTLELSGGMYGSRMINFEPDDMRYKIYGNIIEAIQERPFTGYGLGTFSEVFARYRTLDVFPGPVPVSINKGHSDLLEIYMTAGGIIGSIVVISFIYTAIKLFSAMRGRGQYDVFIMLTVSIFVQLGLHSVVDFSMQMPANSYLFTSLFAAGAYLISGGDRA